MLPQIFDAAKAVDQAFLILLGFSVFVLVMVTGCMCWFLWKYHYTRHPKAADIEGNLWAEIVWTVLPTLIVLGLFHFGWSSYKTLKAAPEGAMTVQVEARMFSWAFTYPNGKRSSVLVAPVDTPVKLDMTSVDVIHSFYVPAMRIKMDTVPGMTTQVWFKSDTTGDFDILCAEYCGLKHANMITTLKVVSQGEFDDWLDGGAAQGARGLALLEEWGCLGCHTLDGTESAGPTFKGIFGRTVPVILPDGSVKQIETDEAYLRRAILQPSAEVVQGFDDFMPPYEGEIPDDQVQAMVDYLASGGTAPTHPGRELAEGEGCLSCHSTDGSEVAGPSFKDLYGSDRKVKGKDGEITVIADETYLHQSIVAPSDLLTDGYDDMMPPYDYLTDEQMEQLIDYIRTLRAGEGG